MLLGRPIGDVCGCGNTHVDIIRVPAGSLGGVANRGHGPVGNRGIGKLEDEAVSDLASQGEHLRAVRSDVHRGAAGARPRKADVVALVLDRLTVGQPLDVDHGLAKFGNRDRLAIGHAHRGVTAADTDHGAVAVHLIESGVSRGGHGDVASGWVGDHRADDHLPGLVENLAVDHVRLFPQDVRVESPDVREAVGLCPLGKVDHSSSRGSALQNDADVHVLPLLLCA